jgi:hypothetical protein
LRRKEIFKRLKAAAMNEYVKPPFPRQTQAMPGSTEAMRPRPDHGETSYRGSGRLVGKKAIVTGGAADRGQYRQAVGSMRKSLITPVSEPS